jgi:hypothetical protein
MGNVGKVTRGGEGMLETMGEGSLGESWSKVCGIVSS